MPKNKHRHDKHGRSSAKPPHENQPSPANQNRSASPSNQETRSSNVSESAHQPANSATKQVPIPARRTALDNAPVAQAAHSGLLLSKYLCRHNDEGTSKADLIDAAQNQHKQKKKPTGTSKAALIDAAQAAMPRSHAVYQQAYQRWEKALKDVYGAQHWRHTYISDDRLAIGLGNASPLEVGLTLHHTYGVPFIPGSALKGLAAGYADAVWATTEPKWQEKTGEYHRFVFGDTKSAGCIDFLDAWIMPSSLNASTLQPDVMTPHHSTYYEATDDTLASDWDSPVPVPFVTVNKGVCFSFYLGCAVPAKDGNDSIAEWLEVTADLLCTALEHWGIGGKTSAGYGRMVQCDTKN